MAKLSLVERACALQPFLLQHRAEIESLGRLTDEAAEAAGRAGMFRAAAPADVGGEQASLVEQLKTWEALALADSAVAWCAYNSAPMGYVSAFLNPDVRREVYSDPDGCFGFSGIDGGQAMLEGGTISVSGRWPVVSGCHVSSWFLLGCRIRTPDAEDPRTALVVLPRAAIQIEDTWHVGGMRGTGSNSISVADARVPVEFAWWFTPEPNVDGPLYRIPYRTAVSPSGAAVALGIAQSAIDALRTIAEKRYSATTRSYLRDQPSVQDAMAEATATLNAARTGYHLAAERLWASAGDASPSLETRAAYWASQVPVVKAALDVASRMYQAGGAESLLTAHPLERAVRDLHALDIAAQRWQPAVRASGRVMLGMAPEAEI